MCQRLVGHGHVRPNRLNQFLLGHKTVSVFNKIAQDLEGLWAQLNVAVRSPQRAAPDIQRISLELKHFGPGSDRVQVGLAMKSQANYQLCQRNYTVLSGLRPPFAATSEPVPIACSAILSQEAHHETSAPNIPEICLGLCCRARVFTRRSSREL